MAYQELGNLLSQFRRRNTNGYLDYALVREEMDELMKYDDALQNDFFRHHSTVFEYGTHSRDYFLDLCDRIKDSNSGPVKERIALYVVSVGMDSFFFHRGRVFEPSSVIYKAFCDRMSFLASEEYDIEHMSDPYQSDALDLASKCSLSLARYKQRLLLSYWRERDKEKDEQIKANQLCWKSLLIISIISIISTLAFAFA